MKLLIVCSSNRVSLEPTVFLNLRTDSTTSPAPLLSISPPLRGCINMTKHWPEQSLLAPAALFHTGDHRDHQLDFCRNVQRDLPSSVVAQQPAEMAPQQPPNARNERSSGATPAHSSYPGCNDANTKLPDTAWRSEGEKSSSSCGKKKNYQRYPKPPYSYLAMIAMVIQRSPEKKLTLSEVNDQ